MDKQALQDLAQYHVRAWWVKFLAQYPTIQRATPIVTLNNRLKTTAGRAFIEENPQKIDLSTDLFCQYTDHMIVDTIPHELAHLVAYTIHGDPGHGKGWYSVLKQMGIQTTRCHSMVNYRQAKYKGLT
jgi:SprT protein